MTKNTRSILLSFVLLVGGAVAGSILRADAQPVPGITRAQYPLYRTGTMVASSQASATSAGYLTSADFIAFSASGDVTGPAVSTNKSIPTWNGTGGDTLQNNSGVLIDAGSILMNDNTYVQTDAIRAIGAGDGTEYQDSSGVAQIIFGNSGAIRPRYIQPFGTGTGDTTTIRDGSSDPVVSFNCGGGGCNAHQHWQTETADEYIGGSAVLVASKNSSTGYSLPLGLKVGAGQRVSDRFAVSGSIDIGAVSGLTCNVSPLSATGVAAGDPCKFGFDPDPYPFDTDLDFIGAMGYDTNTIGLLYCCRSAGACDDPSAVTFKFVCDKF